MNEPGKDIPSSGPSFYDKAAWFIFFAPAATVIVAFAVLLVHVDASSERLPDDLVAQSIIVLASLTQWVLFVLGLIICFKRRQHRRRVTLWITVAGVVVSLCLGVLTLMAFALGTLKAG